MTKTRIITFRIPIELLNRLDKHVEQHHYIDRSDFIRKAIQEKLEREAYTSALEEEKREYKVRSYEELGIEMIECPNCGKKIPSNLIVCPHCTYNLLTKQT